MEAWKFVNYTNLSPVFALSFTAERWGLEPFPGNLVATTGYLQDTVPVWTLPYSCPSSNDSSFLYYYYYSTSDDWVVYGYNDNYDNVINISGSYNICTEPQPCADSGCLILIEGIGKTTTGPANSSIVGLSHGISIFLIIAIAIAIAINIIMGSEPSKILNPNSPLPPPHNQLPSRLRPYMNPPQQHSQQLQRVQTRAERAETARKVARCSELLRKMYALDLKIWSLEESTAEDIPVREEMMHKANALFAEVTRIVHTWRSSDDGKWSQEERQLIEDICNLVDQHGMRRY